MARTEFYETAVKSGFYGLERGGLFGKKDNVRKHWEDVFIKVAVRPIIEKILKEKTKIRITDLGCGSGEGFELLTHISPSNPHKNTGNSFILEKQDIDVYHGIDISPAMISQGEINYPDLNNVLFTQADLAKGFPLRSESPFDVYFSSYCSLSHLRYKELENLTQQIFSHISGSGYTVFDLHGRYSPEWPVYWGKDHQKPLPYTMAYPLPENEQIHDSVEWFDVTYWNAAELSELITASAKIAGKKVKIETIKDRSILVGRHMDTAFFKEKKYQIRHQVNRLFDRDYRGEVNNLLLDISYLSELRNSHPTYWKRICDYYEQWHTIINILEALMLLDNPRVKHIIESSSGQLTDELKMLAWLFRNADRFPVVDFWASIMGPQVACVLRNLELSLPDGLGCGHSIFCIVEVTD